MELAAYRRENPLMGGGRGLEMREAASLEKQRALTSQPLPHAIPKLFAKLQKREAIQLTLYQS